MPAAPAAFGWRPSRLFAAALAMLGIAGAASLLASDLAAPWSWLAAPLAIAEGLRLARAHLRLPPRTLLRAGDGLLLDGRPLAAPVLVDRGPVLVLRGRDADGRTVRLAWFPDTLAPAARRELRLAAGAASTPAAPGAMAP